MKVDSKRVLAQYNTVKETVMLFARSKDKYNEREWTLEDELELIDEVCKCERFSLCFSVVVEPFVLRDAL